MTGSGFRKGGRVAVLFGVVVMGGCGEPARPTDEMVQIPAGTYRIGTDDTENFPDAPAHEVTLAAFEIDVHEVTNRQFKVFTASSDCPGPLVQGNPDPCVYDGSDASNTYPDYYTNIDFTDYPVVNVRWDQAEAYCRWLGKRLPTEAEWEVAAGGGVGEAPWGDAAPNCDLANYEGCQPDLLAVNSHEDGVSPYGAYNMAGNAAEWVADYYGETYYNTAEAADNPQGPSSGLGRTVRGGSYFCPESKLKVYFRDQANPMLQYNSIGFRCARSL